jgi:hypothetical protein
VADIFLGAQGVLYHGEGRKPTLAVSYFHRAYDGNAVGNLWAVSYPTRKNLAFDTGCNHGLTGTSTRWEAFAGFTYLLLPHRLWKPQ